MSRKLQGKRAVVTGASSGIGRAIALALAARGAELTLHARSNQAGLDELQAELAACGRPIQTYLADFSQAAECERFVAEAWTAGPVDIWIQTAGADVLTGAAAEESFAAKLERLWRVDVQGTITTCRAIGGRMQPRGSGAILTVGWDQAAVGMEGDSGQMFAATKGAVMAFTRSLAKTLAPEVRVNCLAPGWIQTKWGDDAPDYWRRRAMSEALLGRWGTPEDVAGMAAFLVSPEASFITGQVININGGFVGSQPDPPATS